MTCFGGFLVSVFLPSNVNHYVILFPRGKLTDKRNLTSDVTVSVELKPFNLKPETCWFRQMQMPKSSPQALSIPCVHPLSDLLPHTCKQTGAVPL